MPWYDVWGSGIWLIFPIIMCFGMMGMMLVMGRGRMGWCGGEHEGTEHTDSSLETLRQRFASGDLTQQEYEEQKNLLLRD